VSSEQLGLRLPFGEELRFQHFGDPPVELLPLSLDQSVVKRIFEQGVLEDVRATRRPTLRVQDLGLRQLGQLRLESRLVHGRNSGEQLVAELTAEDRGEFGAVLEAAGLPAPRYGTALSYAEAKVVADEIGYPVLVRPSYVLGGRGMEIVYDDATLEDYVGRAAAASPGHPVLIDRFLDDAIEIDVDALYDGEELFLGGVMEHIEEAGIHSGDSACALPPITLGRADIARIRESTEAIARGVGVRGLLNVQYAMAAGVLHVLEANPRASRTVPFVSKATATPLAKEVCSKRDVQKTATGYVTDSVCSFGNASITTHSEIAGDLNSAYTIKSTSHSERGPIQGDHVTTIQGKWLGPCKPDQKPGDIVMPGGFKLNVKDADKLKGLLPK